jgi:formylglycine-generating enzyme required for sulfatase activity
LDKYEVTIGRFRAFLDNYDEWRNLDGEPQPGAASHPRIPGSGWQERYLEHLPASAAVFEERLLDCAGAPFSTWTAPSGTNQVPLNCVTWYEAAAFCAWDEGRLPTFAEWSYAAGGGAEDRTYPWGNEVPSRSHAMYGCTLGDFMTTCVLEDVLPVGSHPLGAGRYGQHDLAGSIAEWTLDAGSSFTAACTDCASLGDDPIHYWRGGSFGDRADDLRNESSFKGMDAMYRLFYVGLRCARDTGP